MLEKNQLEPIKRQIGLMLVVCVLPLFFNPFVEGNHEPTKVVIFLIIVLGMLFIHLVASFRYLASTPGSNHHARTRRPNLADLRKTNPLAIPALVYVLVNLIATILSVAPRVSWFGNGNLHGMVVTIGIVVFFLLAANTLRSWWELHQLIRAMLLVSVAVVAYGFAQYLRLDPLKWSSETLSPVQSTLGLTIYLGAYLVLLIPFSLALMINLARTDPGQSKAYGLIAVMQLMCLVFTLSRSAALGLTIGTAVFCWLVTHRLRTRYRFGLTLACGLIGVLIFTFVYNWGVLLLPENPTTLARLEEARGASNSVRTALWRSALHWLPDSLLFGYGPETLGIVYLSQDPSHVHYEVVHGLPLDPHNILLYQLSSAGVIGFLAFSWFLLSFYRVTFSALHRARDNQKRVVIAAIIASATGYLVQAQFQPDVIVPWSLVWLVFALGVTANRLTQSSDADSYSEHSIARQT